MDHYPAKCVADLACLGGVVSSVLGYLPTVAAVAASILAAVYYGLQVYDRLKKGKSHG